MSQPHPAAPAPAYRDTGVPAPVMLPAELIPERKGVFAFLSNIEREGRWMLPRQFRALSVFGNVKIDLTSVELGAETLIEVRCLLGNVEIIVPPSVRLDVDGDATIGNFEVKRSAPSTLDPSAPFVHIKAGVVLGSIDVTVVDPNAPKGLIERMKARWKFRDTDPGA